VQRAFVILGGFDRKWTSIGLDDEALRELQTALLMNNLLGEVITGTGGIRKARWPLPGRGKSGGLRIFYVDFPSHGLLFLLTLLQKNESENLSKAERNILAGIVEEIQAELTLKPARRKK